MGLEKNVYKRAHAGSMLSAVGKIGSSIGLALNNKFYVERYLTKLQIYTEDIPNIIKRLLATRKQDQACRLEKLLQEYKMLIQSDLYLNVKTGPGTFETYAYEKEIRNKEILYVINTSVQGRLGPFSTQTGRFKLREHQIFLGLYRPLCPLRCGKIRITTEHDFVGRAKTAWSNRSVASVSFALGNFYSAWMQVEMLTLQIEAIFKDIELQTTLSF